MHPYLRTSLRTGRVPAYKRQMKWFVISEWNGRVHCSKTDQPFQKQRISEQLATERERYVLTPEQSELPLDALLRLADEKKLVRA